MLTLSRYLPLGLDDNGSPWMSLAVTREVLEETGIRVQDIRYFGSQPWPFPDSLMLGFNARYDSGEIQIALPEIEAARWFRADQMPSFFPGRMSISQWLIQDFLDRHLPGSDPSARPSAP